VREGVIKYFDVKQSDVVTVYNGCLASEIASRADLASHNRKNPVFTIGMVASLENHKDQPTLIKAAKVLKEENLEFRVILVGDGSRKEEYVDLVREAGVKDRVEFLGVRKDIPELLGGMDVFVYSAKKDEGMGIALAEAMIAGVPVVATDVGACREVLEGGSLGVLVSEKDPKAMAGAIKQAINDPDSFKLMAKSAKKKALRDFGIEKTAAQYAKVLKMMDQ